MGYIPPSFDQYSDIDKLKEWHCALRKRRKAMVFIVAIVMCGAVIWLVAGALQTIA